MRSSKSAAIHDLKTITSDILKNVRTSPAKNPKQLERHLKGVANHRRIQILTLIAKREGITLDEIAKTLACNLKTIAVHTTRLTQAGLVDKKYVGRTVAHKLSPYGAIFYHFLRTF